MIRNNLSTRPFYNERMVSLVLLAAVILVLAATVFNISRIIYYSRSDTELAIQASQDEARTAQLRAEAARLRASVDAKQVEVASIEARQANDLINRRTFSWTELWNLLETTLPAEVRITTIRPAVDDQRRTIVTVSLLARSVRDINEFMENLDASGQTRDILPGNDQPTEGGQIDAVLQFVYTPGGATPAAAPAAAATVPPPPQGTAR
jgi:Tfp pilus assembly protein PilN